MQESRIQKRSVFAWALYDWANSAFATTVMAGFFPIFFKKYWSMGSDVSTSTMQLGLSNSVAGLIVAFCSPILGAIADNSKSKKNFLFIFACLGVISTALLCNVGEGDWQTAALLYVLSTIGFVGGNVFYDSLIMNVSRPDNIDRISAIGFSCGYLGGGILFAINVLMYQFPDFFHISSGVAGIKISFLTVAVWWALFSLPLFLLVKDHNPAAAELTQSVKRGLRQLIQTGKDIKRYKNIVLFLVSYWVYIDGVHTIIVMAIDYGLSLGLEAKDLIASLLLAQIVGFPATLAFGAIAGRFSARTGILIALCFYTLIAGYSYFLTSVAEFYVLAGGVGLVQGGVQCLSRSFFGSIIPRDKSTQFFGFYNMMGKFATIVGPTIMASVAYLTGNPRLSIVFISVLFIIGGVLLCLVKDRKDDSVEADL